MKFITFFCLLFAFQLASAQTKVILSDKSTREAVAYASIRVNNKANYYSNEEGKAEIALYIGDTLLIESLGYQKLCYVVVKEQDILLLEMEASHIMLKEVSIIGNTLEKYEQVGFYKPKISKKQSIGLSLFVYSELAVHIVDKKLAGHHIKNICINLKKGDNYQSVIKIFLYEATGNQPGALISTREITFKEADIENNGIKLNIEDMQLLFPAEGLFVSLQTIGFIEEKSGLIREASFFSKEQKKHSATTQLALDKNVHNASIYKRNSPKSGWIPYVIFHGKRPEAAPMIGLELE